ncbi:MAG: hypothetical protein WAM92_08465 [Mycobacterium sp.]
MPNLAIHSSCVRRAMPAVAVSAAVTLGVIGYPAGARAEPVWDIEEYDDCTSLIDSHEDPNLIIEEVKICCEGSGGVWQEQGNKCVAPRVAPGPGAVTPSSPPRDILTVPGGSSVPPRPGLPTVPVQPPAMG